MWEAVSETFHCKFMLSSKSMYIIFYTRIIIVYINIIKLLYMSTKLINTI